MRRKILPILLFLSVQCVLSASISGICTDPNPEGSEGCPCDWVHRDGKCFKLFKELQTFDEAEATCKTLNGHLASITSRQEHDFLLSYILRDVAEADLKYVWVGGRRKRTRYIWMDLQPFVYADWHGAHATYSDLEKHKEKDCVQLVTTAGHYTGDPSFGTIVNHPCTGKDNFICQRPSLLVNDGCRKRESRFEGTVITNF